MMATPPDLCHIKHPAKLLITSNNYFYIFNEEWLWLIKLKDFSYGQTLKISAYFDIKSIDFIYQGPSGETIIISELYYMVEYPTFQIKPGYSKTPLSDKGLRDVRRINGIVNTYSRKTYIFYNNYLYAEINEYTFEIKRHGLIHEESPGVSPDFDSVFHYINGNLYFLEDILYEFNEFKKCLIKAVKFDFF